MNYEQAMEHIASLSDAQTEALYECEDLQDEFLEKVDDTEEFIRVAAELENTHRAQEAMQNEDDVETRLYLCEKYNLTPEEWDLAWEKREHDIYVSGIQY